MDHENQIFYCPCCERRQFICAGCGKFFNSTSKQEDVEKEFQERYGHSQAESDEEIFTVCDECAKKINQQ